MPNDQPTEPLEWTEANLSKVIADIYAEAAGDSAFYEQLMSDPYSVLSSRINVPEEYNKQVFARQKNKRMVILNVPDFSPEPPAGTTELPDADYQLLCSTVPPW